MKKNLIILSSILASALVFILVLVARSDSDKFVIEASRNYKIMVAAPEDTIRFPEKVSVMKVYGNWLFGYVNKQKTVYRYNLETHKTESLLHTGSLFSGIINGVDIDPEMKEPDPGDASFYFLNANANKIYSFHVRDSLRDSLYYPGLHLAGGEKCFSGNDFFIRSVNDTTGVTLLLKADYHHHTDTPLYTFAHFPDAGISADGFFLKNKPSKKLFYIPYYNAEIIQYDEGNNKISKIRTIDNTVPANKTVPTSQGYTLSGKSRMINTAGAADSSHLYILSYTSSPGNDELPGTVVDIYSTATGLYEYSLLFPYIENNPVTLLEKSDDKLFVAFNKIILRFTLHKK
ncbi:hypothetical protein ACX0G9_15340 [Flavitalea flava]